uniref:Uncharacterized protein n=1 Tax=Callorhinchus milii TaxID=7868 RepID=A0A4W3GJA2_CALMI
MALAAFAFVKRNQLQRRFCRKKRSQIYKSEPRTGSEVPGREANNAVKEGVSKQSSWKWKGNPNRAYPRAAAGGNYRGFKWLNITRSLSP